ncbi:MAG TPA: helix-turn-helix domain-containing protein [Kofleriaceae bacterium]|nr:helix-turn-helix domain-containing protein [Kofleriaceae bacterium]
MRISVLVVDDVFDTGLAAVLDAFETADTLARAGGLALRYRASAVGVRRRVRTHHGLRVPVTAARPARPPDLVVVPALAAKRADELEPALARPDVRDAIALVGRWGAAGARLAAACTGTFLLGEAGALDRRRATTSWWLTGAFRRRFPRAELTLEQMVVADGPVVTAGAALAHLDLVLSIIRRGSPALADQVARHLLLDERASQAPFAVASHLEHDDPLVRRFEGWARAHLDEPFALRRAARAVAASERTLQRRVAAAVGRSPLGFVQDLRLERAVHLLRTTGDSVDEIAARVGYGEGGTLRALLRRRLRVGVRALRPPVRITRARG